MAPRPRPSVERRTLSEVVDGFQLLSCEEVRVLLVRWQVKWRPDTRLGEPYPDESRKRTLASYASTLPGTARTRRTAHRYRFLAQPLRPKACHSLLHILFHTADKSWSNIAGSESVDPAVDLNVELVVDSGVDSGVELGVDLDVIGCQPDRSRLPTSLLAVIANSTQHRALSKHDHRCEPDAMVHLGALSIALLKLPSKSSRVWGTHGSHWFRSDSNWGCDLNNLPFILASAMAFDLSQMTLPCLFDATSDDLDTVNRIGSRSREEEPEIGLRSELDPFRDSDNESNRVKMSDNEQYGRHSTDFNAKARENSNHRARARLGIWEAIELLDTLTERRLQSYVSRKEHLFQTAEAIRRDGKPEWMQAVGLVHELGRLLIIFEGEGQWGANGETFLIGCRFLDTFANNPDFNDPVFSTIYGVYQPRDTLDNVMLSWVHDESDLPEEALAMIRFHSFYHWHREGVYQHVCSETDAEALMAVKVNNPYALYSTHGERVDLEEVSPYYRTLVKKYFPAVLTW
ncbi:hypothetical protein NMY22_g495 [Coprinellus aureogranulatus]|nr:hypothetical protein NMY22_g495 [Coprinellus aureogranulatus]